MSHLQDAAIDPNVCNALVRGVQGLFVPKSKLIIPTGGESTYNDFPGFVTEYHNVNNGGNARTALCAPVVVSLTNDTCADMLAMLIIGVQFATITVADGNDYSVGIGQGSSMTNATPPITSSLQILRVGKTTGGGGTVTVGIGAHTPVSSYYTVPAGETLYVSADLYWLQTAYTSNPDNYMVVQPANVQLFGWAA